MIKIRIADIGAFKAEYIRMVKPSVQRRLELLQKTMGHFQNIGLSANGRYGNHEKIASSIAKMLDVDVKKGDFSTAKYYTTFSGLVSSGKFPDINQEGVQKLLSHLLADKGKQLEALLVCEANILLETNDCLLSNFRITTSYGLDLIKEAFDYEGLPGISRCIKSFFRSQNIVQFCPYCNDAKAMYSNDSSKNVVDVHQLDHFFDKGSRPLLSYSLFNLVPSDYTCNTTNKGVVAFDDVSHLNPYLDGFGLDMTFEPVLVGPDNEIDSIKLFIGLPLTDAKYRRMAGDVTAPDDMTIGNINVFKLKTKYNRQDIKSEAGIFLRNVRNAVQNRQSILRFLEMMDLDNSYKNYESYYKKYLKPGFHHDDFGNYMHSKLYRDLHDYAYKIDTSSENDVIREIIRQSYSD